MSEERSGVSVWRPIQGPRASGWNRVTGADAAPPRCRSVGAVLWSLCGDAPLPLCAGASFLFANKQDVMSLMSRSGAPRGRNRRGAEEIRLTSSPPGGSSSYSASDGPPPPPFCATGERRPDGGFHYFWRDDSSVSLDVTMVTAAHSAIASASSTPFYSSSSSSSGGHILSPFCRLFITSLLSRLGRFLRT